MGESACFYIGTFFWNLESLGCIRGRGPRAFAPRDRCWGPPGPRADRPSNHESESWSAFCRLSLDQSDPPRLGRDPWARRAVYWPSDAFGSLCSQTRALMPSSMRPQHLRQRAQGCWYLERLLSPYKAVLCRSPWPPLGSTADLRAGLSVHSQVSTIVFSSGDMSSRHFKPEIRVTSLRFSPTGEPGQPFTRTCGFQRLWALLSCD